MSFQNNYQSCTLSNNEVDDKCIEPIKTNTTLNTPSDHTFILIFVCVITAIVFLLMFVIAICVHKRIPNRINKMSKLNIDTHSKLSVVFSDELKKYSHLKSVFEVFLNKHIACDIVCSTTIVSGYSKYLLISSCKEEQNVNRSCDIPISEDDTDYVVFHVETRRDSCKCGEYIYNTSNIDMLINYYAEKLPTGLHETPVICRSHNSYTKLMKELQKFWIIKVDHIEEHALLEINRED